MALLPWGKIDVGTNEPPKEETQMSRDIKYIGMDVHKEAIVIAVLLISWERVTLDGTKIKANAGGNSFRRKNWKRTWNWRASRCAS
jgi:hypothetical protein